LNRTHLVIIDNVSVMFFINLRNDKIIPNAASEDNKKMQGFFRA